jgi:hypothetical protein
MYEKYKWRKNTKVYKLYVQSKNGEIKEVRREEIFKDENYSVYTLGDRVFINFVMKPKRQLMVALKSRGYWWNAYDGAWSTYLSKLDIDFVSNLSTKYEKYI